MYYKHLNGFSRAPGNGKSCWSVGDTKISFLNTLAGLHCDPSRSRPRKWGRTNETSKKFLLLHMEKFHTFIAGADPAFCLHTQKSSVKPRMWDRTLQIWRSTKGRSAPPRNQGRWFAFILRGKKRVWPRIWGSTPQSEQCVNAVTVNLAFRSRACELKSKGYTNSSFFVFYCLPS